MIFWREIVIFHTKYPKTVCASLRYCYGPLLNYLNWGGGGGRGADDFLLGPRYIGDDFFFRVDRSLGAKQEGPMIVHF